MNRLNRHGECPHGKLLSRKKDGSRSIPETLPDYSTHHIPLKSCSANSSKILPRACKAEEPIIMCVFCHGDRDSYGLEISREEEDGPLLSVNEISNILAVNESVNISIMMTSCFSGGWTVTPLLKSETQASKAIILTAADQNTLSELVCSPLVSPGDEGGGGGTTSPWGGRSSPRVLSLPSGRGGVVATGRPRHRHSRRRGSGRSLRLGLRPRPLASSWHLALVLRPICKFSFESFNTWSNSSYWKSASLSAHFTESEMLLFSAAISCCM